jgi:hypothetical protein
MLAVAQMDPTVQALFFTAAVVLFLLAAFGVLDRLASGIRVELTALGLAAFAFVPMWNAWAAA